MLYLSPFLYPRRACLRDISQLINSSRGLEPPLPPGPPRSLDICQMGSWETLFGSPSFVHTYLFHALVMSSDAITPRCTTTLPAQETAGEDAQNEKRGTKKKKKETTAAAEWVTALIRLGWPGARREAAGLGVGSSDYQTY